MLKYLSIENYALIRKLDLEFNAGFTVITGETGAGKSILLGALSLILGNRADHQVLLDKQKKCIVEGNFDISHYDLRWFFKENELDFNEMTILRREIMPGGRSRAFINDTPVSINAMKELGDRLVNIHSQHETITLNNSEFQLAVLDSYAGIWETLKEYRRFYQQTLAMSRELSNLIEQEEKQRADLDYFRFQLDELNKAKLIAGEQEELEEEQKLLEHAEDIKSALFEAGNVLQDGEMNVTMALSDLLTKLGKLKKYSHEIGEMHERISSSLIELNDIADNIHHLEEKISYSPKRQEEVKERLDIIYQLQYKHRAGSVEELVNIRNDFESKILEISSLEDKIKALSQKLQDSRNQLFDKASQISDIRVRHFPAIEKAITETIRKLGMPHGQFKIRHQYEKEPGYDGIDDIQFLFNANKGGALSGISKIASGGELSRLMLAIKSLISIKNLLPTIIFDEIDSGVSGEVAGKVGEILRSMSDTLQVFAITHLPQIAGKGRDHFKVMKETDKHSTFTVIRKIENDERITEIAQMLSGEKITDSATETAKHLMDEN